MNEFFQQGPELKNQYDDDHVLRAYLRRKISGDTLAEIEPGLKKLGARAAGDLLQFAEEAERNPPKHIPFDAWGKRVDEIQVSESWKKLDRAAAEEGIVATAYERKLGALSRIHQFVLLYLYHPSSAIYSCPLAMTDGAARAIELYGDESLKSRAFSRLTSRDPLKFWTSGQWMTERTGGSDVSGTSTVARLENGKYRLYGTKWFTSATTSQMAMTLARIEGAESSSKGLSLFYLELRDASGKLNGIEVHRLKDKLGTKALPTAELTLTGAEAHLVGSEGNGVRKIASLFNITRIYNSVCALGYMRRGLALAIDYANKRSAFGRKLIELPAHVETLASLEVEFQGALQLVFRLAELLGKEECGEATPQETLVLRLLTPIAKLYTAKQSIATVSEVLECFGGAGYVEDTNLPRLLRDAQVLAIWEGTTNVLSLDALRAIEKDGAFEAYLEDIRARLSGMRTAELSSSVSRVRAAVAAIQEYLSRSSKEEGDFAQAGARAFAFSLARTYTASLLLEQAQWSLRTENDRRPMVAALRWCKQELAPLTFGDSAYRTDSLSLL